LARAGESAGSTKSSSLEQEVKTRAAEARSGIKNRDVLDNVIMILVFNF